MFITSAAIENGYISDKFGNKGFQFTLGGIPSYSLPITIHDAPENTVSFSIVFDDEDAMPVCGFVWTHWLVANIKKNVIHENESISAKDFIQGINSWNSEIGNLSREESTGYGGPAPPDKVHTYSLKVYALDKEVELENGFTLDELKTAMNGHIIEMAEITGKYHPK